MFSTSDSEIPFSFESDFDAEFCFVGFFLGGAFFVVAGVECALDSLSDPLESVIRWLFTIREGQSLELTLRMTIDWMRILLPIPSS